MKSEISSFIFRWRGYLKKSNEAVLYKLKNSLDEARTRYSETGDIDQFELIFLEMQYEKGVKIVFE
jgi:hypothetical protein